MFYKYWFLLQFHSVTEKRAQNSDCGENSVTIVTDKKIEDDTSSGENVDIGDGKRYFLQNYPNKNALLNIFLKYDL